MYICCKKDCFIKSLLIAHFVFVSQISKMHMFWSLLFFTGKLTLNTRKGRTNNNEVVIKLYAMLIMINLRRIIVHDVQW